LLHGLGRLYVVLRAEARTDVSAKDISEIANSWQATIGRAILASWGLPEPLLHAVEHQDDFQCERDGKFEIAARATGPASLTDLLVAAKILVSCKEAEEIHVFSGIRWLNALTEYDPARVMDKHGEEIQVLRSS